MKGLELMLTNMLGISPEQMRATFEGIANAADTAVLTLKKIESQNDEILSLMKGEENGPGRTGSDASGSGSESGNG